MNYTLLIDVKTPFGVVPKGTDVVVLDDNTPLNQSFRVHPVGEPDKIFGVKKRTFNLLKKGATNV